MPERVKGIELSIELWAPPRVLVTGLERVKGIEPSLRAWEARVLPLNYTRNRLEDTGSTCVPEGRAITFPGLMSAAQGC
jgi:hypothetical protein